MNVLCVYLQMSNSQWDLKTSLIIYVILLSCRGFINHNIDLCLFQLLPKSARGLNWSFLQPDKYNQQPEIKRQWSFYLPVLASTWKNEAHNQLLKSGQRNIKSYDRTSGDTLTESQMETDQIKWTTKKPWWRQSEESKKICLVKRKPPEQFKSNKKYTTMLK